MNQILEPDFNVNNSNQVKKTQRKKTNISKIYKIQFTISTFIAIIFLIIFFIRLYNIRQKENISKSLMNSYSISTIYSNTTDYSVSLTNNSANIDEHLVPSPFVIGMLKIDKISLNYPILSDSNKNLLEISLCRFAGPMPNTPRELMYCWAQLCRL